MTEGQEARLCEVCYGAGTKAGQREAKVKIKGAGMVGDQQDTLYRGLWGRVFGKAFEAGA